MIRLAQLSDLHFGREDVVAIANAGRYILETRPDAVLICGDLTQKGRKSEFEAARRWIDELPGEKLVVPGNHDTPMFNIATRVSAPFERFEDYFGDLTAPLDIGGRAISGLNTARGWQFRRNWAEGSVDLGDLEALAAQDSSNAADILICHHPFMSMPGAALRTRTRRGRRASRLTATGAPFLALFGHVHTPSAIYHGDEDDGYLAVSSGTLSTRLRQSPPGFNMVSISSDRILVEGVYTKGDRIVVEALGDCPGRRLELLKPEAASDMRR